VEEDVVVVVVVVSVRVREIERERAALVSGPFPVSRLLALILPGLD